MFKKKKPSQDDFSFYPALTSSNSAGAKKLGGRLTARKCPIGEG
ncbi:spermidine/putrescine ABC transporter ATP-binding protein [Bacillus mycoides]|nr:spermidine/putrescine ABC transporter ATP-binding protein [Bacillus mycoides]